MRWAIVYVDGSRFTHADGEPHEAPGGGVVAIAQEDAAVGSFVFYGRDFYVYDEEAYGGWMFLDHFGLTQHIVGSRRPLVLKLGQSMDTARYRDLLAEFKAVGLGKSARYEWEAVLP